ncbi:hypothetical protein CYMTET_30776 [Cymbomonas tetramitiformis]|uniref:Nodulin-like domain-containing protein n=1 Tax=Cymbomonas tetramitiformis TaxID=36881 RepID=A0AAE0KTL4_9CHLO|nr:hypothetical protein CYMTET_30776 [Cymbomonas tetramitiformis]
MSSDSAWYLFIENKVYPMPPWYNRWHSFSASIVWSFALGHWAMFNMYADSFKDQLGYTQEEIDWLAVAKNGSVFFGIFLGITVDVAGVFYNGIIGGTGAFTGFILIWAVLKGYLTVTYTELWWIHFFAYGSIFGLKVAPLLYLQRMFPRHRATFVGIVFLGSEGLGAACLAEVWQWKGNTGLVLTMAIFPLLTALLLWPFVRVVPKPVVYSRAEQKATAYTLMYSVHGSALSVAYYCFWAVFEIQEDIAEITHGLISFSYIFIAVYAAVSVLLVRSLVIKYFEQRSDSEMLPEDVQITDAEEDIKHAHTLSQDMDANAEERVSSADNDTPKSPNKSLQQAQTMSGVKSSSLQEKQRTLSAESDIGKRYGTLSVEPQQSSLKDQIQILSAELIGEEEGLSYKEHLMEVFSSHLLYLLVVASFFAIGGYMLVTDNLTYMIGAIIGYDELDDMIPKYSNTNSCVCAWSRLLSVLISDEMMRRYKWHRGIFLMVGAIFSLLGMVFFAVSSETKLYFAYACSACGYGIWQTMAPVMVFETFGWEVFGFVYMFAVFTAMFFGSLVGSIWLYEQEFNDEAELHLQGTYYCRGNECFDYTCYTEIVFMMFGFMMYALYSYLTETIYDDGDKSEPLAHQINAALTDLDADCDTAQTQPTPRLEFEACTPKGPVLLHST